MAKQLTEKQHKFLEVLFEEAKGEVITNYQNYLEDLWKIELEKKYPAEIYSNILYKLID